MVEMAGKARSRLSVHNLEGLKSRVDLIVKLLRADFYDSYRGPRLRELAGKIVAACPTRAVAGQLKADFCEASAVCEWVAANIRYTGDTHPIGEDPVDLYQSPWQTIRMGLGDCDCMVAVVIALLTYLGFHCWLRVSSNPGSDTWDHIYAVVSMPKVGSSTEMVVDPTLGPGKCGVEALRSRYVDFYK